MLCDVRFKVGGMTALEVSQEMSSIVPIPSSENLPVPSRKSRGVLEIEKCPAYLEGIQIRCRAYRISRKHLGLLKLLQRNLLDLVRHGAQKLEWSVFGGGDSRRELDLRTSGSDSWRNKGQGKHGGDRGESSLFRLPVPHFAATSLAHHASDLELGAAGVCPCRMIAFFIRVVLLLATTAL